MNNQSWRHHYIPQFYLKGFLNENKKFAVYDKQTDRVKSGEFSTKSHFFAENRNVVDVNGVESDFLETKVYQDLDDTIAKLFRNIQSKEADFLTFENLFTLKMFISFLYWRIPKNDKLLESTIDKFDFKELGFDIVAKDPSKNHDIEKIKEQFKKEPAIRKMYSVILPFSPNNTFTIAPAEGEEKMWKAIGNPGKGINLTCDNPILTMRDDMFYGENQKMIFPVSSSKLLYYGKTDKVGSLPAEFYIHADLATVHIAERYVCGPSKSYLEDILEMYNIRRRFNKTDSIIPELFAYFD